MKNNENSIKSTRLNKSLIKNSSRDTVQLVNDYYRLENESKNMIKGKLAESIIAQLFSDSGYTVSPFGVEHVAPLIKEPLRDIQKEIALQVREMPDFIVVDKNSSDAFFIEVKYRWNGVFNKKEVYENYHWPNTFFIVVSKKHIKCLTYIEIKGGKSIDQSCKNYLGWRKEFKLRDSLVKDYCKFVSQIFANF